MFQKISLCKTVVFSSATSNALLKKIHQTLYNTLNREMHQEGFKTWEEIKNYGNLAGELEALLSEKTNKYLNTEKVSYRRIYKIPELKDTLGDEVFDLDEISIKVVSMEKDNEASCLLKCYLQVNNLILLNSFGPFLLIATPMLKNNSSYCIKLGTDISIVSYKDGHIGTNI